MGKTITVEQLKRLSATMKDKGYVLAGLKFDEFEMVILAIHKDWKVMNLRQFWDQTNNDLPDDFKPENDMDIVLEIPTLDMFEKRWEKESHGFMIIVDERRHN